MIRSGSTSRESNYYIDYEDRFRGPVHLLLELIQKKKMDIYEISLNYIIEGFIEFLRSRTEIILDTLSGFIYTAAILLEIKSRSLIPSKAEPGEQDGELEINILKRREEEYRIFKRIANLIDDRAERESFYFIREAPLEKQFVDLIPELLKDIGPADLAEIAARMVFKNEKDTNFSDIYNHRITISIFDEMERIKVLIEKNESFTFKELSSIYDKIIDRIISFLSILELYKNEQIEIVQFESFGNIVIKKI